MIDRVRSWWGAMTNSGAVVAASAAVSWILGWQLGWVEFMALCAGCLLALVAAVPFVVGKNRVRLERSVEPHRVVVGEQAVAVLRADNPSSRPTAPQRVEDKVGASGVSVDVPALTPGESREIIYPLPTRRRQRIEVGPAVVVKADPLRLLRREVGQTSKDILWVHPAHVPVRALPVGFAKDLEGPTSDASPAGDVAFHALREYQFGDDYRHIHWLSTARSGTVMIRHYVDNRRPELAVLLDARAASYERDSFETAVSAVASLVVSSKAHEQPIAVWFGDECILGHRNPGSSADVMDRLTLLHPTKSGGTLDDVALRMLRSERGASAFVPVSGAVSVDELALLVKATQRWARTIAVRVWSTDDHEVSALPNARLLDVANLHSFRAAWNRVAS